MTTSPSPLDATLRTRLERGLDFTPSDLDANRQGRVSDRQGETIRQQMAASRRMTFGLQVLVGVVSLALTAGWLATRGRSVLFSGAGVAMLTVWLVLPVAGFLAYRRRAGSEEHLREVSVAEGTVEAYQADDDDLADELEEYGFGGEIMVGDFHAVVTDAAFHAFEPERRYRVYYLGRHGVHHLLSAEALDEPSSGPAAS